MDLSISLASSRLLLPEGERRRVLDELLWCRLTPSQRAAPTQRPLPLEEAVALAQGELIQIGPTR